MQKRQLKAKAYITQHKEEYSSFFLLYIEETINNIPEKIELLKRTPNKHERETKLLINNTTMIKHS